MRALIIAGTMAIATPLSATTVTYEVFGSEFTTCDDLLDGAGCAEFPGWIGRSFDGTISLDLDALGLPHLGSKTVNLLVMPGKGAPDGISMDLNFIGPRFHDPTGAATFSLTTDALGNPVSWLVDVLDGPPDYWIGSGQLGAFFSGPIVQFSGNPGSIRPITAVPIPLPASLLLLIGGGMALAIASRRRTPQP